MSADSTALNIVHPRLIWGHEVIGETRRSLKDDDLACQLAAEGFRWLHLNLSDVPSRRWIEACPVVPAAMRELLLAGDNRQRAVVDSGFLGLVLQDIERDFDERVTRVGIVRFAIGPGLMLTARSHPVHSADIIRDRIEANGPVASAPAALELLFSAMAEAGHRTVLELDHAVQAVEDDLLRDADPPDAKTLVKKRLLMVRMHRLFHGNRAVLRDLMEAEALPAELAPVVAKAADKLSHLDTDLVSIQGQLRLLREEIDLQATGKTNQNLYVLSILSALLLPATLVTGVFGMNTGGLPWMTEKSGTLWGILVAVGLSGAVYVWLRMRGFFRQ